ncbi:Uncharacterised protein [Klebsiella pneumoniae]|uniref:Uncharacterized protein n=1 Tax=Klebsiella pneumoniae TaxID=573 RepID=A0A2X3EIV9_KLEPN|nr:Uncharacterised protein [Klebsiella pneumoniae]
MFSDCQAQRGLLLSSLPLIQIDVPSSIVSFAFRHTSPNIVFSAPRFCQKKWSGTPRWVEYVPPRLWIAQLPHSFLSLSHSRTFHLAPLLTCSGASVVNCSWRREVSSASYRKWRVDTGNSLFFDGLSLVFTMGQLNRYHPYPLAHQAPWAMRVWILFSRLHRQDASQSSSTPSLSPNLSSQVGDKAPAKPGSLRLK